MKSNFGTALTVAVGLTLGSTVIGAEQVKAATLHIDNFDFTEQSADDVDRDDGMAVTDGPDPLVSPGETDIHGTTRTISAFKEATSTSVTGDYTVEINGDDLARINSESGVDGIGTLLYHFPEDTNLIGTHPFEDFRIVLDILSNDLPGDDLSTFVTFTFTGPGGTATFDSLELDEPLSSLDPVKKVSVDFADFTLTGTFGFDDVEKLELVFDTPIDGDISFDNLKVEKIPFEAESAAGLALLASWGAWKKWKHKQSTLQTEEN